MKKIYPARWKFKLGAAICTIVIIICLPALFIVKNWQIPAIYGAMGIIGLVVNLIRLKINIHSEEIYENDKDIEGKLQRLQGLKEKGLIDQKDYDDKKKKILEDI